MGFDPQVHRHKSVRLRQHDRLSAGFYFVTICTYKRRCLFGDMVEGSLQQSSFGAYVEAAWREIPNCHRNVGLDAFVVMPNHLHGIVSLNHAASFPGDERVPAVHEIVRAFKARCAFYLETNGYLDANGYSDAAPVWQRNYHEHVIRDEKAYVEIVQYIESEPQQWQKDIYNARRTSFASRAPIASRSRPSRISFG